MTLYAVKKKKTNLDVFFVWLIEITNKELLHKKDLKKGYLGKYKEKHEYQLVQY